MKEFFDCDSFDPNWFDTFSMLSGNVKPWTNLKIFIPNIRIFSNTQKITWVHSIDTIRKKIWSPIYLYLFVYIYILKYHLSSRFLPRLLNKSQCGITIECKLKYKYMQITQRIQYKYGKKCIDSRIEIINLCCHNLKGCFRRK